MDQIGFIKLGDRHFSVESAWIDQLGDGEWIIEIDAKKAIYDGQNWKPRLYHQGLNLGANSLQQLSDISTSWGSQDDTRYPHPEHGFIYVFEHLHVYECQILFGKVKNSHIAVSWVGKCDVFWDKVYGADVPLHCECLLSYGGA